MKKLIFAALMLVWMAAGALAQVTSEPTPLQVDSRDVVIYFHADQGNRGLLDAGPSEAIYAHTGVITNLSTSNTDWKYATPSWTTNLPKYKLEYVSPNLWKLNIGTIDSFYGVPAGEVVKKLAFVFRNANGTRTGRTESGSDIMLDVLPAGLQVQFTSNPGAGMVRPGQNTVSLTATASAPANLTIEANGTVVASESGASTLSATYTFADYGNYTLTATAQSGDQKASAVLEYCYPRPAQAANYPGGVPKMGTSRDADGNVIFCFAAPEKESVILVGSWNDYAFSIDQSMNYQDYQGMRYFWISVPGLAADKQYMYYYMVDGTYSVGDPYARLVLDPQNDKYIPESVYPGLPEYPFEKVNNVALAVYQENINDYDWQVEEFKGPAPSDLIIYELLLRDFTGTEGKALGNGTVRGAHAKINYLNSLGVNAVELLPINEFNGNISWGYNPNFYFAPDKAYGTPDDYKAFIDACHKQGLAVILDIVFNQTDWQHPWYQMYPVGENPFYNADAPHAYSVLNDWNQEHPLVQQQFEDALRYWLTEYKVDGFRFDLVKGLGNNDSYANSSSGATDAFNQSRIDRMRRLQQVVLEVNPNAYFINENLATAREENEMASTGQLNWANFNTQGGQYAAGLSSNSTLSGMYAPDNQRTWGSTVSYLESHDEQRLAYIQNTRGEAGVKGNLQASMRRLGSAAAQMILSPGAHLIWQFSEMGNDQNTKTSSGNNTDPKIVNWNLLNDPDRAGLRQNYAELNAIRNDNPELFAETANFKSALSATNWEYGRFMHSWTDQKEILCVINPSVANQRTISAPFNKQDNAAYQILSKSYGTDPQFNAAMGQVTVPANSYVVIGTTGMSSAPAIETAAADVSFSALPGGIAVTTPELLTVRVYTAAGVLAAQAEIEGNSVISLPAGLYIATTGSTTAKLLVR